MLKIILIIFLSILIYSCSPINKQHGYLLDDVVLTSDKISKFQDNVTKKEEILEIMGTPSIEIQDVDNIWIYLVSLKEKKVFDEDMLLSQLIYRFAFNSKGVLISSKTLTHEDFEDISFSNEKTSVDRNAYSITDQLYDAFTRGQ